MYARIGHVVGSTLSLVGAFAIGAVLHQSFVEEAIAITAPISVLGIALGAGLIALGRRLEGRYEDDLLSADANADGGESEDRDGDEDDGTNGAHERDGGDDPERGFDERWAPFDAADLEKYERDDSEDATRSKRR